MATQSDPESGSIIRRQLNERSIRTYHLRWTDAAYGELFMLQQVLRLSGGGVFLVDYTPISEVDANKVEGTFVPDSFASTQIGLDMYEVEIDLEERL